MSNTDPTGQTPACFAALLAGPAGPPLTGACLLIFFGLGVVAVGASGYAFTQLDGRQPVLSFPLPEEPNPWAIPGIAPLHVCEWIPLLRLVNAYLPLIEATAGAQLAAATIPIAADVARQLGFTYATPTMPPVLANPPLPAHGPVVFDAEIDQQLKRIFTRNPSNSYNCVSCAQSVLRVLRKAGYNTSAVGITLYSPGGYRAPLMRAKSAKNPGEFVQVANTGYHEAVEIITESGPLYIDSLVYEHFGLNPVDWETYQSLWEYPEVVIKGATD